jgi:hypothetical protein
LDILGTLLSPPSKTISGHIWSIEEIDKKTFGHIRNILSPPSKTISGHIRNMEEIDKKTFGHIRNMIYVTLYMYIPHQMTVLSKKNIFLLICPKINLISLFLNILICPNENETLINQ